MPLEEPADRRPDGCLIFHQQQRLRSALRQLTLRRTQRRLVTGIRGKKYDELRTLAWLALDQDASAALLDDAVHRRQSEASAARTMLGGKERLEDPLSGGL